MSDAALNLLGVCLRDSKNFDIALARGLTVDCFFDVEHATMFLAMLEVEKAGSKVDVTSLAMAKPHMAERLIQLRALSPIAQSTEALVDELLTDRWRNVVMEGMKDCHVALLNRKPYESVERYKATLIDLLGRLLAGPTAQISGPKKISAVLDAEIPRIESDHESGLANGIPTGMQAIDKLTSGGFKRGSVNVIAARTGMGKTTMALNIAHHVAMHGFGVCYFTVEMPAGQLARKLLSLVGEIKGSRVMTGTLGQPEFDRLWAAQKALYSAPLWIDDTFRASFEAFEISCRRLKRQAPLDLVVIDYIQQLSIEGGRFQTKQQAVTEISHKVKQLALELDFAVLSLAQFNRDAEKNEGEPCLWQIKDSGAIEQDADLGVCLFRDERDQFWLKIDKNRWGKDRVKFPIDVDLSMNLFRNASINPEAFA